MKKIVVLLFITIFMVTGCSVKSFKEDDIDYNIDLVLSEETELHNVRYDGYKYYLPKGISFVRREDYNALLKDSRENYYYMYVDTISYFHKIENDYKINNNSYVSQKLSYNKKDGYIQIDEYPDEDMYFIQYVFNYVKMESFVSKEDLVNSIINMSYILRSVKFNDSVLNSLIGENILDYKEEDFTLFKADSTKESYMEVAKRNESEEYSKYIEDEKIELDY